MIISSIYRCEYCGKEYLTRSECEKCEASHGHNIELHKRLEKILKEHNIFYKYQRDYHTLYIYKIQKIFTEKDTHPDCNLVVEVLEIRLNAIFDWYRTRVNDGYDANYFVDDVEAEQWKPVVYDPENGPFSEIHQLLETKSIIEFDMMRDPVISKYNALTTQEETPALEVFTNMFENRKDLDISMKDVKKELKDSNGVTKIATFTSKKQSAKKGKKK